MKVKIYKTNVINLQNELISIYKHFLILSLKYHYIFELNNIISRKELRENIQKLN